MAKKDTEVAVQDTAPVALFSSEVPDFLRDKTGPARGSENVGAADLIIPRLEVVQALSPCRKKSDAAYIEGAEEGMIYNNVTRDLYGSEVMVVPVAFVKQWLLWKNRKKGGGAGGFRGAFNSELEAETARDQLVDSDGKLEEDVDIVETAQHFCLAIVNAAGKCEEVVLSMAKSKQKVSKKWNSLMRINGGDTFGRVYRLGSVTETNARNEEYYNFSIANGGFVNAAIYKQAEALYEQIMKGGVKVSDVFEADDEPAPSSRPSGESGEF